MGTSDILAEDCFTWGNYYKQALRRIVYDINKVLKGQFLIFGKRKKNTKSDKNLLKEKSAQMEFFLI